MKHIYTLLITALLAPAITTAQVTWDNFENERRVNYGFISGVLIPYNENPDQSGANTSQVAAQYIRNGVEQFDVILMQSAMASVTDYVNGTKTMSMDIWSPQAGVTVQITLENASLAQGPYPAGRHSEYQATTTVAEQWETLTFNLTGLPDGGVTADALNQLVLLIAIGTNTSDTYFIDNIRGPELANPPCEGVAVDPLILNDFECQQNVNFLFSHSGTNFERVMNPDQTINTSSHVASYVRNGAEATDVIIGRFPLGNLSLTPTSQITLDVWDPNAPTTVVLSLQTNDGDIIIAPEVTTTVSSEWQTLIFDVGDVFESEDISQFVILFDPGNTTSDNYFFDNLIVDLAGSTGTLTADVNLRVFPNPGNEVAFVAFELTQGSQASLMVTDLAGKTVYRSDLGHLSSGEHRFELPASQFPSGAYLYTLTVHHTPITGKFFVKH
jgi:hypothetical protein